MEIRILRGHEVAEANQLIHRVFMKKIAPYYQQEGIDEFLLSYQDDHILSLMKEHRLIMIGAFDENMIGVIGIRNLQHIHSLFVDEDYQGKNIGTRLLEHAKLFMLGQVTVNSNPNAVSFYERNGFVSTDREQVIHGIHFVPMVYQSFDEMKFHTYDEVHEFINSQKNRVYALDHFKKFMNDICNPQVLLKTIHIGGTNGKGSTTNYIRSVLQEEGYKVATFTSPVLVTRLEIMRVNNEHIHDHEIIQYANRYMSLWLKYELSLFEIEVFIAIMFFIKKGVDFAIFEVGMGGALDATNIVYPIVSANTNIGLDHTEYLGDTYEKIAYTKGGIIKENIPFITGEKKRSCLDVFEKLCQEHHSPLLKVQEIRNKSDNDYQVSFDYRQYHVVLDTPAIYQCENSALAIEILLYLKEYGYIELKDEVLLKGLQKTSWAGRFEVVCQSPFMIIDGAHNKEGIEAFYQSAKKYKKMKIIFSALKDKDTHAMLEKLLMLTDDITVCEFDFNRAQDASLLAENFPVQVEKDWHKAVDEAFSYDGVVFITGSLYFIAQVRPYIQKHACNQI